MSGLDLMFHLDLVDHDEGKEQKKNESERFCQVVRSSLKKRNLSSMVSEERSLGGESNNPAKREPARSDSIKPIVDVHQISIIFENVGNIRERGRNVNLLAKRRRRVPAEETKQRQGVVERSRCIDYFIELLGEITHPRGYRISSWVSNNAVDSTLRQRKTRTKNQNIIRASQLAASDQNDPCQVSEINEKSSSDVEDPWTMLFALFASSFREIRRKRKIQAYPTNVEVLMLGTTEGTISAAGKRNTKSGVPGVLSSRRLVPAFHQRLADREPVLFSLWAGRRLFHGGSARRTEEVEG
ncbi:hypothetical protein K0M31_020225 [Melipona bicolor]|uniref:Uncharacterized protein n=1 Tax=Melipona bicolor TaxID=60889 RepID=A0AA40G159_9HYME|nr:hypothetical protein K0M31_020225 [Melipona bicolor]